MKGPKLPVTPAVRVLRAAAVPFEGHTYEYVLHGGTHASSLALGVDEHAVVKTLVMEDEREEPLIVLMHGDRKVSTRALARAAGRRTIRPCAPAVAERHTGYQVGGTSPFGTRRAMPVFVQRTILELPRIWINGGKRGFLVSLVPSALTAVLGAEGVDVAIEG